MTILHQIFNKLNQFDNHFDQVSKKSSYHQTKNIKKITKAKLAEIPDEIFSDDDENLSSSQENLLVDSTSKNPAKILKDKFKQHNLKDRIYKKVNEQFTDTKNEFNKKMMQVDLVCYYLRI